MFDNVNVENVKEEKEPAKKTSLFRTFTDEELAELQAGKASKEDEQPETKKQSEEEIEQFKEDAQFSNNNFLMMCANIERILAGKGYEELIVSMVDDLLLDEQNAINEDTKKRVSAEKYILGLVFTTCNCYGDQRNFLYLMADRLGFRR